MNRSLVVLGLTTTVFASASAYLWTEVRAQREEVSSLRSKIESLRSQPTASIRREPFPNTTTTSAAAVEAATFTVSRSPAPHPSTIDPAIAADKPASARERAPTDARKMHQRFMEQQRALFKDPEYVAAFRTQQRMMLSRQYPALAEDLELSPDVEQRLLDVLVDQQLEQMLDADPFDPAGRGQAAMEELQRKLAERTRANEAAIAQVLGDQGLERWRDYQNTMGARFRAQQLSQALDAVGMPLREDQRRELRHLLAQHERDMQKEAQTYATRMSQGPMNMQARVKLEEEQLERTERYYERARNAVSGLLSPDQLEQYKKIHEQELAMRRAQLRVQRAHLEANGTDDPPGMFMPVGAIGMAGTDVADD